MGCWHSKQGRRKPDSYDDNTNIVPEEEQPFQDEKEKEKTSASRDGLELPRDNSMKERKSSKDEEHSSEKNIKRRNSSKDSDGPIEKKSSFINRISNFRKSKHHGTTTEKSISSADSKDEKREPTKEEVESWAIPNNGFETMMACEIGRPIFEKFLKKEFSSENLLFWIACEELRKVRDEKLFKERVEEIFTTFLDAASPQEVSLDFKVKENVMKLRDQPIDSMFDEAQSKIYTLMHRDSFPRFLNSNYYKEFLSVLNEDQTDSKVKDSDFVKQDSDTKDEGCAREEHIVSTERVDSCDSSQDSFAQPKISIDIESTSDTKDISESPIVQDSALDPNALRGGFGDSPNSFRTVTLDTEYDKLLNLIE